MAKAATAKASENTRPGGARAKPAGKGDRMVSWWNRTVIDVPLEKVIGRSRTVDPDGALIRTARALGICLGDDP